jgi:hypothetical protein
MNLLECIVLWIAVEHTAMAAYQLYRAKKWDSEAAIKESNMAFAANRLSEAYVKATDSFDRYAKDLWRMHEDLKAERANSDAPKSAP